MEWLRDGERLDDLEIQGYKLIQNRDKFCFGIDAVLLSNFAVVGKGHRVVDLGTGTGVIPILLAAKTEALKIVGVEIQDDMVDMARRSVALNSLEDRIDIVQGDIAGRVQELKGNSWDIVISNPPYKKFGSGIVNTDSSKAIARHEIMCTLEDVLATSAGLLKHRGRFFMIHRPDRFMDIVVGMRAVGLEPKRVRMVHPYMGKAPNLVLIEGVLGGGAHLTWMPPLFVYDSGGNYTREIDNIYGRKLEEDDLDG